MGITKPRLHNSSFSRIKLLKLQIYFIGPAAAFAMALTTLVSGCNASIETICSERFPEFETRMSNGEIALGPWNIEPTAERGLAAVQDTGAVQAEPGPGSPDRDEKVIMSWADRESWQEWTRSLLKDAQAVIDTVNLQGDLQPAAAELHQMANLLVVTGGYAQVGDAKRMIASISLAREKAKQAHEKGCKNPR